MVQIENLGEQCCNLSFPHGRREHNLGSLGTYKVRGWELAPQNFSIRVQGKLLKERKTLRKHVIRHCILALLSTCTHHLSFVHCGVSRHDVSDNRLALVDKYTDTINLWHRNQGSFNLPKFNSEAIDLHLRILSAQDLQQPRGPQAAQISCPEELLPSSWMSEELLAGTFGILVVPGFNTQAPDVDNTSHPMLAVLHAVIIENLHGLIPQRNSIRN
mmetsp:Transcript_12944/g.28047  ORF Transcript_12944/g.28047 Transcript_12944/m.28047 type:complete len:216 (-) Transcript_12944:206-853(-)